ncbi:MAG: nodulation protein NfeD, partial [Muribaculaceae bacterium]|nr:nodulation protein NfeD [Muribaculaceae bacterium]
MKQYILLVLSLLLTTISAVAEKVYIMPVDSEIDLSMFHHFRKACTEAEEWHADMFMVKLNTYGGAVDAADSIRTALLRLNIPTVAFVDQNAASAGALIALACDSVYMAPGSSMGSATVVNGAGEPMPQKYQSYMSTIMRSTAEHHGKILDGDSLVWRRNPMLAQEMVNPDVSISFTPSQAVEAGFADGIASNVPEVLSKLDITNPEIRTYDSSLADSLLGFLSSAAVRAVLVMLILGGIYMEMHTPGLGFAAAVAVVAAALYFLPMLVIGSLPGWVIICFIAGVVLIALEVFVIPGFGICGIAGICAI